MKNLLLFILLALTIALYSQNSPRTEWGIRGGLIRSVCQFPKIDYTQTNLRYPDTLINVKNINKLGVQAGFSIAYNIHEKWQIRIIPSVELREARWHYFYKNGRQMNQIYEAGNACFPIQSLWKINKNQHHFYTFVGINPKYNLPTNKSMLPERFKRGDISLDFGGSYSKIKKEKGLFVSPELYISLGLRNLIKDENTFEHVSTGTFQYHSIGLILHLYEKK